MRNNWLALVFVLFTVFTIPMIFADTSTVTVNVAAYTSITLSSDYVTNVTFGEVYVGNYANAAENGDGAAVHSAYYVTFIGNTLGNITYNCTDFIGAGTLTRDNFLMHYDNDTAYASVDYMTATNFTSEIEYGNLISNTTVYSNYFMYVPETTPAGDYSGTLTISVEAA